MTPTVENKSAVEIPQVVVGEKRPPPRAGLFDAPAAGSKRQKQSRYIVVDGHAVLKDNNYGITQGYISVFDGGDIKTGAEAAGRGGLMMARKIFTLMLLERLVKNFAAHSVPREYNNFSHSH